MDTGGVDENEALNDSGGRCGNAGCHSWVCVGGAKTTTVQETKSTTLSQELMDLDAAHKQGTISTQEHEKQNKLLLEKE